MQTIGFLSHLRSKGVHGPFMVVGPLSTLPNWVSEFARWCPSMPCILYHGNKAERQALRSKRMPSGAPYPPAVLRETFVDTLRVWDQHIAFRFAKSGLRSGCHNKELASQCLNLLLLLKLL